MITNPTNQKLTTPGPFMVSANTVKGSPDHRIMVCVVKANQPDKIVAITGVEGAADENQSIANAALFSIAPEMLDALIAIQEGINSSLGIDEEAVNEMLQEIFKKLANEAGEEL